MLSGKGSGEVVRQGDFFHFYTKVPTSHPGGTSNDYRRSGVRAASIYFRGITEKY